MQLHFSPYLVMLYCKSLALIKVMEEASLDTVVGLRSGQRYAGTDEGEVLSRMLLHLIILAEQPKHAFSINRCFYIALTVSLILVLMIAQGAFSALRVLLGTSMQTCTIYFLTVYKSTHFC